MAIFQKAKAGFDDSKGDLKIEPQPESETPFLGPPQSLARCIKLPRIFIQPGTNKVYACDYNNRTTLLPADWPLEYVEGQGWFLHQPASYRGKAFLDSTYHSRIMSRVEWERERDTVLEREKMEPERGRIINEKERERALEHAREVPPEKVLELESENVELKRRLQEARAVG